MLKLSIHNKTKITEIQIPENSNLLYELQKTGHGVYSPCGGNGTCGKCKVYIKGEGYVSSCLYVPDKDLEIFLPDPVETNILVAQYIHSLKLPFKPGKSAANSDYPLGIAIDIGTTTLVFYLVNFITTSLIETHAVLNPQMKYGADVISRINYCIMNKDGLALQQAEIIRVINEQIKLMAKVAEVSPEEIIKITVSGNTTMLHLLTGTDPSSLAFVPFKATFLDQKHFSAKELGLNCSPVADFVVLPSLSAYVGADVVCGLSSINQEAGVKNYLYIDLGTNGEMALITPEKIFACSTAAGPAFEAANISCGMPALEGAVSAYGSEGYTTIADNEPIGICGSGLIDITAYLLKTNKLKTDGLLPEDFIVYEKPASQETGRVSIPQNDIRELQLANSANIVSINQNDIRELQLAKSAIYSGIRLLIKHAGISMEDIDILYLAGGFGNYINIENAMTIGLLPQELKGKIVPVGNASGTGAMLALQSEDFYEILQKTRSKMILVELSEDEDFAMEFAINMEFPEPNSPFV